MIIVLISLVLMSSFPDVLTQKSLCEKEARKIDLDEISSVDESVRSFLILLCAGRRADAEKILKEADDKFPDNFVIKFNLGSFYIQEGKLDFAIFYLNQAKKINPVPQVFDLLSTAYLYRGDFKSSRGVLDEAIAELRKVSSPSDLLPIYVKRGYVSLLMNDLREAEKSFRKAIEIEPTEVYAYIGLAESLGRQNKDSSAIEVLSKIETLSDDPILYLFSAVFLHSKGYLEMATRYYLFASDRFLSPMKYVSKLLLSSAQRDLGIYNLARENFEEVARAYPDIATTRLPFFPEFRLRLALTFLERGNIKGAETEIREILRFSPENSEAQKVLTEILLMKALLFSDKSSKIRILEEARNIAKKYIDKNPSDDEMLYRFALISFWLAEIGPRFVRSGNIMHAISSLQSAIKLKEKREYVELLGVCYYVIEKYDDAISELQKIADHDYAANVILASAYLKIGEVESAKKVLHKIQNNRDKILAMILYNIAKAQKSENIHVLEEAIIEGNYDKIFDIAPTAQDKKEDGKKDVKKDIKRR